MPQLAADIRRFNGRLPALSESSLSSIAMLAVPWLIVLLVLCSAWVSASAQTPINCLPYSSGYPCIYVADLAPNQANQTVVSAISASTNTAFDGSIPVSSTSELGATAIAVTPNNAFTYVALKFTNQIAVIKNSTNSLVATLSLTLPGQTSYSAQASQIVFSPNGAYAWVTVPTCYPCTPSVQVIDTSTVLNNSPVIYQVSSGAYPPLENPQGIVLSPDGTKAYVADNCPNSACIDVIDTASRTVTNQIALPATPNNNLNASIAIAPDGSLVCMSVFRFSDPISYGVVFLRTSDNTVLPTLPTFLLIPTSNLGMGITQDGTLYLATSGGVVLINTANPTQEAVLQVGSSPTAIAVGPDDATVYVTDSSANLVSVLKGGVPIATIPTATNPNTGSQPQGIAIMPSLPPTIITQPTSQTIGSLQSATLSVAATGTPPLTYQWYQGQSGDISAPISGATSSSYITPAALPATTSYWVAVSNLVTSALSITAKSTTASIMPTLFAPTCVLALQGAGPSTSAIMANATCSDPQLQSLVTTLSWGAGANDQTNSGSLIATRTLAPAGSPYTVTVSATDSLSHLTGSVTQFLFLSPAQSVFAGQAANVSINIPGQSSGVPINVSFVCRFVIDSNGVQHLPADLGISCVSTPPVITLGPSPQSVTIAIQTTGGATTIAQNAQHDDWAYALLLPFPVLLWLGAARWTTRTRPAGLTCLAVFACGALLLLSTSCGGGFIAPPKVTQLSTPPGSYQITIGEVLSCPGGPCQNFTDFIQTTLIVPLVVSPTQ